MSVQRHETLRKRLLSLRAAIGVAALALVVLAGACTEEDELGKDTPAPQQTQTATAAPSQTLTPISTPTLEASTSATPQPATATAEVVATSTPAAEPTEDATSTPTATEPPTTTTPESAWEFPDIPAAPEGLSGEASLADLMTYLDNFGSPVDSLGRVIETKDFGLWEGGGPPEDPGRITFEVELRKPGGIWVPGDEAQFEEKRDDFLKWFADRRNLVGDDCLHIIFSKPPSATMLNTAIDRRVTCPESGQG
jgi:hypothetical protein